MGPSQICGCPFREPRFFEIAHIYIYIELQPKLQLRCVDIAHGYGLIWHMQDYIPYMNLQTPAPAVCTLYL